MTTAEVAFYTGAKSSNRARMEGTVLEGTVTGCQGRTKVDSHRQFQVRMGQSKGDFPAFGGELFSFLRQMRLIAQMCMDQSSQAEMKVFPGYSLRLKGGFPRSITVAH